MTITLEIRPTRDGQWMVEAFGAETPVSANADLKARGFVWCGATRFWQFSASPVICVEMAITLTAAGYTIRAGRAVQTAAALQAVRAKMTAA